MGIPAGIAAGLAASGAGGQAARLYQGPDNGGCCGGLGTISAAEAMKTLTIDILTLRAGAQLRKRMLCETEQYHQTMPPGVPGGASHCGGGAPESC